MSINDKLVVDEDTYPGECIVWVYCNDWRGKAQCIDNFEVPLGSSSADILALCPEVYRYKMIVRRPDA